MANALGTPGGFFDDEDHRLANAGFIAPQTSSLAVRTGVMVAPGISTLVSGTAATGTMTYGIAPHHWVTSRATGDGVYIGTLAAATTVPTAAAPGANSRIDIIWSKQNDLGSTITPDTGTTQATYGVTSGTAAASPTAPTIPVGAVEIGRATVATGATSTNSAQVTISQTARLVSTRGAPVYCRSQTERDALTTFAGLVVVRLDTGNIEVRNSANSGWNTVRWASTTDSSPTLVSSISGASVGASWDATNLRFARRDGQLFVWGSAGKASWTNGETVVTLPAGWRPIRDTEWTARIGTTYYPMVLNTSGQLGIFVANTTGAIWGDAIDTFAVIGSPTLLA